VKKIPHIAIGKIGSTYGVHGWLKVYPYPHTTISLLDYSPWLLSQSSTDQTHWTAWEVEASKIHGKGLVVKFATLSTPEEARLLTGKIVALERSQLPPPEKNEYYWSDLIGLTVINKNGEILGKVLYLLATGANDVLVIQHEPDKKEYAIPYLLNRVILNIDLNKQEIQVDWELI